MNHVSSQLRTGLNWNLSKVQMRLKQNYLGRPKCYVSLTKTILQLKAKILIKIALALIVDRKLKSKLFGEDLIEINYFYFI